MLAWLSLLCAPAHAVEWCNGVDDDGDGDVDEGPVVTGFDADFDGYSAPEFLAPACAPWDGPSGDCDDGDPEILPDPGAERCDGTDGDCDGVVDDSTCPCPVVVTDDRAWQTCLTPAEWADAEESCRQDSGWTLASLASPTSQLQAELVLPPFSGGTPFWIGYNDRGVEDRFLWSDGSDPTYTNWRAGEPENGGGPYTNEDCTEIEWTGEWDDQPCSDEQPYLCEARCSPRAWHPDRDGDGLGDVFAGGVYGCDAPDPGWVTNELDCDDDDADQPAAGWTDGDGDGVGSGDPLVACGVPVASIGGDCDDGDAAVSPGAPEVACNGVDDDCSPETADVEDEDGDGWDGCDDCDDGDDTRYPGAVDDPTDGVDSDCDGAAEQVDSDGDGLPDDEEREGDTDGDGVPDVLDPDSDGDGALDGAEDGPAVWDAGGVAASASPAADYGFGCDTGRGGGAAWGLLAWLVARRRR